MLRSSSLMTPWLALLIVMAGCSSSATNPAADVPSQDKIDNDFVDQYSHAVCDPLGPCCDQMQKPLQQDHCLSLAGGVATAAISSAKQAGLTLTAQAASSCIDKERERYKTWAAQGCLSEQTPAPMGRIECPGLFGGTRTHGQGCAGWFECAAPTDGTVECVAVSSVLSDAGSMICQEHRVGQPGDHPCSSPQTATPGVVYDCETDTVACQSTALSETTCMARTALSGACSTSSECELGLHCAGKACASPPAAGASCAGDELYICGKQLYCQWDSKTCVPRKKLGEACSGAGSCSDAMTCSTVCDDGRGSYCGG